MTQSEISNTDDISRLDPYMAIPAADESGIKFHSPFESPFRLAGNAFQKVLGHSFRRIPPDTFISESVDTLSWYTAGIQLQFKSTSRKVVIKAQLKHSNLMHHMPQTGSSGFDIYVGGPGNWQLKRSTRYAVHSQEFTSTLFEHDAPGLREFLINFPLYNGVESVWIGLEEDAVILPPTPWSCDKPAVVYGTSITQGGCASHPGGAWTNILSRWHNAEFYNFGFSGSGKGEPAAAEMLTRIENPRCFILDYEANAHYEGIRDTLEKFLDILRNKHPHVPITVISKAPHAGTMLSFGANDICEEVSENCRLSREFQKQLIAQRRAAGDDNIYFVDGLKLLGADWGECMMDGCHFNDLGFYRFAENLNKYIKF